MIHTEDCPDPDEIAGVHACCPCPYCMDTGYLDATTDDTECDCGAQLQTDVEMFAEVARLASIGVLEAGLFVAHPVRH